MPCSHRGPLVVSWLWKKITVELEVLDAAAVGAVVKSGVMVGAKRFGAQLTIVAGGRGVPRGSAAPVGGSPGRVTVSGGVLYYGCGLAGHLRKDCRVGHGAGPGDRPPFRCWGCGAVQHGILFCLGRSLPVADVAGVPAPAAGSGAASGGIKRGGGHLAGSGFRSRTFSGGSVLGYLGGGAGRVAVAP